MPGHDGAVRARDYLAFLHAERNFCRSLPFRPLASASFEHSIDFAVRALGAALAARAAAAAGVVAISAFAAPQLIARTTQTTSTPFTVLLLRRKETPVP